LKSIKIIETPPGFASEEIRKQWVGVTIPLLPDVETEAARRMFKPSESSGGHIVDGHEAVEALVSAGRHDAASFWARPHPPRYLQFAQNVCEVVDSTNG
jgi:hypothetical protein